MIAFDLGSNTLRAVRIDCETHDFIDGFERIVRTADGLAATGKIAKEAIKRIVEAIEAAKKRLGIDPKERIAAVATEAIRRANNAQEVLAQIQSLTGLSFKPIDGRSEAAYTLLAVRNRLRKIGIEDRSFSLVDIGGGSTEVALVFQREVQTRSFPVGIVTVAQRYGSLEAIGRGLRTELAPLRQFLNERRRPDGPLVATAGTPTTVAAMKLGMDYAGYDARLVNGTRLTREDLKIQLQRLLALPTQERRRLVGVGREDLIAAGIEIFDRLMEAFDAKEAVVIDDGLREGVALAECLQLSVDEILG